MKFIDETIKESEKVKIIELINNFKSLLHPLEDDFFVLCDYSIKAFYIEVHVKASLLIKYGSIDVPIDPVDQAEYRANREILEDHNAFIKMKEDARNGRTFSNIVTEFNIEFQEEQPIKIIGGQHRFVAIQEAFEGVGIDKYHEIKIYFALDSNQRLDIQLISNTNISVSPDLLDRMYETVSGPHLRNWCQLVGFLDND